MDNFWHAHWKRGNQLDLGPWWTGFALIQELKRLSHTRGTFSKYLPSGLPLKRHREDSQTCQVFWTLWTVTIIHLDFWALHRCLYKFYALSSAFFGTIWHYWSASRDSPFWNLPLSTTYSCHRRQYLYFHQVSKALFVVSGWLRFKKMTNSIARWYFVYLFA